jgi:hypothetical protein
VSERDSKRAVRETWQLRETPRFAVPAGLLVFASAVAGLVVPDDPSGVVAVLLVVGSAGATTVFLGIFAWLSLLVTLPTRREETARLRTELQQLRERDKEPRRELLQTLIQELQAGQLLRDDLNASHFYAQGSQDLNENTVGWAGRVERALGETAPEWLPTFEVGYQLPPEMDADEATAEVAYELLTARIPALAEITKELQRQLGPP